jgi:hypothetical protein
MRGIEQAIWWRRISSELGYELTSSSVRGDVNADREEPAGLSAVQNDGAGD